MVEYSILGKRISFSDSELRFFDIQHSRWDIERCVKNRFDEWYSECKTIINVLDGYGAFAENLLKETLLAPLFKNLLECEIYDVTQQNYEKQVLNLDSCYQAFCEIEKKFENILSQQEREEYARAARKAGRARWSGGGFGLSGALKGAAQAGALNMVSGLGHSVVNAVGNASSAATANLAKANLYDALATSRTLKSGIVNAIIPIVDNHMRLVNSCKKNYITSSFNSDKATALYTNAKQFPDKREELLLQAITLCPWHQPALKYIFAYYKDDRATVQAMAARFHVDLTEAIEEAIALLYTPEAKESEAAAKSARAQILEAMKEYNITENNTLNQLEQDCIARICQNVETADEPTCNAIRDSVEAYEALDMNKASFLEKIKQRIEEIWSAEDGEIFDNLYLQTDINSAESIAKSIAYIQEKGRTSASEKYLAALNACTEKNIQNAQIFHKGKKPKRLKIVAIILFILAAVCIPGAIPVTLILLVVAIVLCFMRSKLKSTWNTLTIDGTVIHPTLTQDPVQNRAKGNP